MGDSGGNCGGHLGQQGGNSIDVIDLWQFQAIFEQRCIFKHFLQLSLSRILLRPFWGFIGSIFETFLEVFDTFWTILWLIFVISEVY